MYGDRIRPLTSIVASESLWEPWRVIVRFQTFARTESAPCRLRSRESHCGEIARRSLSRRDLRVFRKRPCRFGPRGPDQLKQGKRKTGRPTSTFQKATRRPDPNATRVELGDT